MISRDNRFHGHTAMRFVYNRGQTVRGQSLAIRYIYNSRRANFRAAVVVSRKVHKSAVVRGRIRRRVYEVVRGLQSEIAGPYDIVITVFSEQLAVVPAAELLELVTVQLRRAGITGLPSGSSAARA